MGEWHREHPELAGTEADPWMANVGHAAAAREVTAMRCHATQGQVAHLEVLGKECVCGSPSFSHRPEVPGGS